VPKLQHVRGIQTTSVMHQSTILCDDMMTCICRMTAHTLEATARTPQSISTLIKHQHAVQSQHRVIFTSDWSLSSYMKTNKYARGTHFQSPLTHNLFF